MSVRRARLGLRGQLASRAGGAFAFGLVAWLLVIGPREVRNAEVALAATAIDTLARDRAWCEASPGAYAATRPFEGRLVSYWPDGRAAFDGAPRLDPVRRDAALASSRPPRAQLWFDAAGGHAIIAMPWREGPCAILSMDTSERRGLLRLYGGGLLRMLGIATLAAVIVLGAAGPMVRRLGVMAIAVRGVRERGLAALEAHAAAPDEIGDVARALTSAWREAAHELELRNKREDALEAHLAATSHDLAIPISVVAGSLSALRETVARGERPAPEALEAAIEELHFVASLVSDLGISARDRAGLLGRGVEEHDLRAIVERVVDRHSVLASARGVQLVYAGPEAPLLVVLEPSAAQQALGNIVLNAVQHTPRGGAVTVTLDRRGDRFVVEVRDGGPGLAPHERLEDLVARGARGARARTQRPDGTGLGLAITARVAALHGWSIDATNAEEGGLAVRLEGPLGPVMA